MASFAWNLKTLRSQADMTQGELAKKIGSSQKTLSSWETGRTEPTIGDVIKICKVFDCPIEKLIGTKVREVGDISYDDILIKLCDLDYDTLYELRGIIDIHLHRQKELQMLENQKKEAMKRIAECEDEIKRLKANLQKS